MEVDDTLSAYFNAGPVKLKASSGNTTTPKAQPPVVENDIDRYLNAAGAPRFNKAVLSAPANSPPAATPDDAATTAEVQVKPVVLSNILARMGGSSPVAPTTVSKRHHYSSSLIGAPAAQTPQGQRNQMIRELRENKSDVTFRPLPQSRRLNAFSQ